MVAGLEHDAAHTKLKLLELERSVLLIHSFLGQVEQILPQNNNLRKLLGAQTTTTSSSISLEADVRRHSVDASGWM
jgi:hypothetical protein